MTVVISPCVRLKKWPNQIKNLNQNRKTLQERVCVCVGGGGKSLLSKQANECTPQSSQSDSKSGADNTRERERERQTDRQTERQTDRQTDRASYQPNISDCAHAFIDVFQFATWFHYVMIINMWVLTSIYFIIFCIFECFPLFLLRKIWPGKNWRFLIKFPAKVSSESLEICYMI